MNRWPYISLVRALLALMVMAGTGWAQTSRSVDRYYKEICDDVENEAHKDRADAQLEYGNCFAMGLGRPKDYTKAAYWFGKAVDNGLAKAKASLGAIYLFYLRDPEKYADGVELLRKAVDEGYEHAGFMLALAYHDGIGVRKDNTRIVQYLRVAAESGHVVSSVVLYAIYKKGLYRIEPDDREARKWLDVFFRQGLIRDEQQINVYIRKIKEDQLLNEFMFSDAELQQVACALREATAYLGLD